VFERFTDRARHVVVLAQAEARMLNHNYIGTEHILLGLIVEGEGIAARALESLNVSLQAARDRVEEIIGEGREPPTGHIPFTPRAKKVLELSLREALQLGHNYIGTEHILLGLIREAEGVAAQVLQELGADLDRVRQAVIQLLEGYVAGTEVRTAAGEGEMVELTEEVAGTSEPQRGGAPRCPACSAALEETLAIKELETTTEGGEPITVNVAYCKRCGISLGVLP
jgi:ATP-dependent Clp protease ATP-binding subunit ClpC